MKLKKLACIAAFAAASFAGANAATILTAWSFDNVVIGLNAGPSPSTSIGAASALGLSNSYNNTNSVSNPDVQSLAGSSTGLANSWRVRGSSTAAGSRGNGWSTNAPIGTQGAQFSGSTFGYNKVTVTFDVYATADAEANLQVQYSTDASGTNWRNATITSAGSGTIGNNTTSVNTVLGSYVTLVSGWNNQITVDLSGLSGVDNDTAFAIRLVNASTGADCVDTTGSVYNNTSGSWTFDNVAIKGTSLDTIVQWTFESYPSAATIITNPVAEVGGAAAGKASSLGFNNGYTYSGLGTGSVDASDVNNTGGSSSGSAGPNAWRVRGAIPSSGVAGIGWNYNAPIGTQGAQYDASTAGYSNIVANFDLYFTSAAEARMCVLYTTDGWVTTNVANSLFFGANPNTIRTNPSVGLGGSPDTVTGTYFVAPNSQGFYNNFIVDFTGVAGVDNNPLFSFRVVNAATGSADCLNLSGGTYNNASGNWRFDNVTVAGTAGTPPPAIAFDPNATVDRPFTNTFTDNPAWRAQIAGIYVNGLPLTNSAYSVSAGKIVFTPSTNAPVLTASGLLNISILAPGFGTAKIAQPLAAGVSTKLVMTKQPAAPSASGGTLVVNPVFLIADQYGNGTTNPFASVTVSASVSNSAAWTLGGDTNQASVNGVIAFTNLTATVIGGTNFAGAAITFTVAGYAPLTVTNSTAFTIGAAPGYFNRGNLAVLQIDKSANNSTFSIIEIKPSAAGQTNAVNITPISATGSNALRMANSATCGKLSLSDDGTLICFAAFADGSSATADETFILNRAAVGMNYTNLVNIGLSYTSTSLGGSQARSCTTLDNFNWIVDDKGGLYEGNSGSSLTQPNLNAYNNVVVKAFGGVPYVQTQKAVGPSLPVLYYLGLDPDTGLYDVTPYTPGLGSDANATDFYLISTNGTSYDVLYIMDAVSTNGIINKYSLVSGSWTANGSFTNRTGGDSLFATTNGNGGVYLYFTTAPASGPNSVVRVTDAAGWNAPMNIISSNVIYTASGNAYLKGLTFVPQQDAYATELTPPPILTAQTTAPVSGLITNTLSSDDSLWRSKITAITVNGSVLPNTAYSTNIAGKIVFDPTKSTLLQTSGAKTIVISAAGYSTNSIVQTLSAGVATQLVITTQPTAPAADGGKLAAQPVVVIQDQYGNTTTSTAAITAASVQGTWTLGGTISKSAVSGTVTFTDLTAFANSPVTGATVAFSSSGLTTVTSSSFNILAPVPANLGVATLTGGKPTFTFTNPTGLSFSVLATNNLTVPKANWPVVGTAVESPTSPGIYRFTNSTPATNGAWFFILRQP